MANEVSTIDMTGQQFSRLTVLERAGSNRRHQATWLCRCACGRQKVAAGVELRAGHVRSCGCLQDEHLDTVRPGPHRERRAIIERALVTGLATGGTVAQIAAVLEMSEPALRVYLRDLQERYKAKTKTHLIAILLSPARRLVPPPSDMPVPALSSPYTVYSGSTCPECGAQLRYEEGCEKCACGYSRC